MPICLFIGAVICAPIAGIHSSPTNVYVTLQGRIVTGALGTMHKGADVIVVCEKAPPVLNHFHRSVMNVAEYLDVIGHIQSLSIHYNMAEGCAAHE